MSQGIISSADTTARGFGQISAIEGDLMRTGIDTIRAARLSWADTIRITVENSGHTKLADYEKWDVFAQYYDAGGSYHALWLPYTAGTPGDNEWQVASLRLNGAPEVYEPGLLNPGEEMMILASLSPAPAYGSEVSINVAACNGVNNPFSFTSYGYTLLHPHTENMSINSNAFYEMAEAAPSDGAAMTVTTDAFGKSEIARKVMYNENDASRLARYLFPLEGISEIQAASWTAYYRCRTIGDPKFPRQNNDVNFNIDIRIRQADGGIRTVIAADAAAAYMDKELAGQWVTLFGSYDFPGYAVVDDTDYLEIVYYGEAEGAGPQDGPGYMQLRIDDSAIDTSLQTRIET